MEEMILITIIIAIIMISLLYFSGLGTKESVLAIVIALMIMIPFEVLLYNEVNSSHQKQKEYLKEIKNHVKEEKPVICYEGIFSNVGFLIENPKLINDNKVLSKDKKVFNIGNCEVVQKKKTQK
ncbi:hypothetical protein [Persephonella sp. KM09-Lau-8]|uniref:hypothetical protein n=1 Tax=Persephonella sp. KM09-Lau-8 TaxID=1158345 RepID=UPI000496590C|nr:hypothetical protein [Persephonella sp. KM09-Lau-8]